MSKIWGLGDRAHRQTDLFLRNGRGLLSCISCIFEIFISIKFDSTYALGFFNWYISMSIVLVDKILSNSGPQR